MQSTRKNIWSVTIEKPIVKFHYFDCEFNLRFFCFVLWLHKNVCLRSNQRWVPNETRASGFGRATFNLAGFPVTHSDRETLLLLAINIPVVCLVHALSVPRNHYERQLGNSALESGRLQVIFHNTKTSSSFDYITGRCLFLSRAMVI